MLCLDKNLENLKGIQRSPGLKPGAFLLTKTKGTTMKKIIILSTTLLMLTIGFLTFKVCKRPSNALYTIGILQTASHPALDAAREGFIETLQTKLGNKIEFVTQNAQGSVATAHTIAQQFTANKRFSGFFAIATPAAQAMSALEKEKPIVLAAVTDPHALGLINQKTNVCGVKDMIDVKALIEMLQQLVPSAKTVGLLYTSGEQNSQVLAEKMREELISQGLTPIDFAISNELDVAAITELACRKTDVILAPTDNTVALSISLIASTALKHKKPLIVSDDTLVASGALAARGIDYKECGKQAGLIAYDIIVNGKKPCDLGVTQAKSKEPIINEKVLETLRGTNHEKNSNPDRSDAELSSKHTSPKIS